MTRSSLALAVLTVLVVAAALLLDLPYGATIATIVIVIGLAVWAVLIDRRRRGR